MEKRVEQIAQIAAVALLVVGSLLVLQPFVTALLSAAIVCFATWPVYRKIESVLGGRRGVAALTMTLLLILVIVLPLTLLAFTLADDAADITEQVREYFAQGLPPPPDWIAGIPLVGENIDLYWREMAASKEKLAETLKKLVQPAQQGALKAGLILGEGVLQLSLATFIGFFFYRDGAALVEAARVALKRVAGDLAPGLLLTVGGTINGVVYGIIGTAIAQGVAAVIGFLIAGVPGALLLGFLTFLLAMVPVGPPLIWGAAAAWLAYQDQIGWAVFMAAWGFFVVSGIDNVIKPLIISRGSSLPFVLVFLGVFGGVIVFGFVGIFLGPTLLAVGFSLARLWTQPAAQPVPPPGNTA
ncbi:MAG: AI-2E family transporter [Betaproteobacteria bacterium]|nr:AI-2E family transporter [Betaproteobacteria bacterium]